MNFLGDSNNPSALDVIAFVREVVEKSTNMSCLTPEGATPGGCVFFSTNMYARNLFGEDALTNHCGNNL
ncbi:hypothetical protein HD554DRAFT_2117148 [Boletus coccyginus]|nr:hypothetical protein HD554DRAFT_2117148 [Boletus coccyginus]